MIKPTPEQIVLWIKKNFGDEYKTAKGGQEIRINNPLSIDDNHHLWINVKKAIVNDFRPNYKSGVAGTFLSFVMKYKNIRFKDAAKEVIGDNYKTYDIFEYGDEDDEPIQEIALPSGFKKFTYEDTKLSAIVKRYLNQRCVTNGKIYVNGVGYVGPNVVFPYQEFGKIVYWQQRAITNKEFLFPDGTNKSRFIYGIDSIDPTEPVVITESIFNALMFENGLAIGGSDISDDQKNKLRKVGVKRVVIAFDNDKAGIAGTTKAYDKMKAYFDMFYGFTDKPKDEDGDWNDLARRCGIDAPMKMLKRNVKKLDFKSVVTLRRAS